MEGDSSVPRGRGAKLIELMKKQKEAAVRAVGAPEEESKEETMPRGRAARLLQVMKARSVGAATVPTVSQTPSTSKPSEVQKLSEEFSQVSLSQQTREPLSYKGTSGKELRLSCNYIRLSVEEGRGVFEYEVTFYPNLDAKNIRFRLVNNIMKEIGSVKVFDGGHILFLPTKITDTSKSFDLIQPISNEPIKVTLIYKKKKSLGDKDCLQLYNVLFKRIMHILDYTQMGRNYYDTEHRHLIPQHRLEVYPGFAVAVDELEGGLMVCLDTQHRVLRTQNAYELLIDIKQKMNPRVFKETAQKNILGSIVLTRYNHKTYIVDDILWEMNPTCTFTSRDGREISFLEYYKTEYNIDIHDPNQPMLLHKKKVKKSGSSETDERLICLVPELCHLTGLSDEMRNDFKVMKDVGMYTRVTPAQRIVALRTYLDNVKKNANAQKILSEWGLSISPNNLLMPGRQLDVETINFGKNVSKNAGPNVDWNREVANNQVITPVDLRNWVVFYTDRDSKIARDFVQCMLRFASTMGCVMSQPRYEQLPDDQTSTYVKVVQQKLNRDIQIAVFISPTMRTDRYSVIKKLCCSQLGVATQVILARTLSRQDKIRSIVTKIALQINCKLGGSLWTVKFPFQGWMICGIDVYHGGPNASVCGFVSSLNESVTRWYSTAHFQTKELGDFYKAAFTKSLERYKNENGSFPAKIIIIRDGVGDGQLEVTKRYEVEQFEEVLKFFELTTTICFIVVQKRINSRVFHSMSDGKMENPPPGTIVDHTITRRYYYDFFLVPQSVKQGTVNPTHYIVLHDTCKLKPDHVQRLCYKLCHLYYNWPGTIRVPAPCQYAHKLAGMVGQYMKSPAAPDLAEKLWYL
ncbi:hypothetical protein ABEB36_007083 [Hypothenemus hampei]|uniref:Uncharacterized protein n=1 Tax=Hypothenemus hampei TaxID=57062 RepID=A0ABD1ET93_HYPHA|nr:AGO3 protein 4064 [Hypothenemus hampei]